MSVSGTIHHEYTWQCTVESYFVTPLSVEANEANIYFILVTVKLSSKDIHLNEK